MLDWACCCSVGCALLAVGQKLVYWPVMPEYRPVSTFTNANYYGAVVEIMLLVCFFRFQTNRQSRGWYLVAAAANLCGLYLTGSMSSAIAACAGIFVYLLLQRRRSLVIWFCILAAAAAVLITYFPALFPRVENVGTAWDQRFSIWMTALHGILEHPLLGQGASAYEMIAPQLGGYLTYHCHNLLLDTLLNFGFVGLGVFLVFGLQQARLLWLRFRNRIGPPVQRPHDGGHGRGARARRHGCDGFLVADIAAAPHGSLVAQCGCGIPGARAVSASAPRGVRLRRAPHKVKIPVFQAALPCAAGRFAV